MENIKVAKGSSAKSNYCHSNQRGFKYDQISPKKLTESSSA